MKLVLLNCLLVTASIFGIAGTASAERLVPIESDSGRVYQVDLDGRRETTTDAGWRHVYFWLSTKGDVKKHMSVASCAPYDLKSEYYGFDWRSDGGGYPDGTVSGTIARVACND